MPGLTSLGHHTMPEDKIRTKMQGKSGLRRGTQAQILIPK